MYSVGQDSLDVKQAITAPTRETRTAFLAAGVAAAAVLIVHAGTASAFRRRVDAMIARLGRPTSIDTTPLPLPDIVRSFAERAVSSTATPATVRLHQNGEMRNGPTDRWRSLTATQTIAVRQPGFVWLARMRIGSLFPATILDAYADETGLLEVCGRRGSVQKQVDPAAAPVPANITRANHGRRRLGAPTAASGQIGPST